MNGSAGGEFINRKSCKTLDIQLKVSNLCTLTHFLKSTSGPHWSLCQTDSGPQALCLMLTDVRGAEAEPVTGSLAC